ncbi:24.1 kDa heat shock protein, mitochondrial-like [Cornus florida]|uniref:24.1 kDa heat shock protein, mitochondrial-like n=1 Tax=Cornus florida TaxID=4283 RepID=UPI0028981309|nr:24.1 kDa heat shock protein, mitochondrial-like [Cornus florida]
MASSSVLVTTGACGLMMKSFPSNRFPTTLFAGFPSPLMTTDSDSDSDDSEAPIPKDCTLKNPFLARGRIFPFVAKEREDSYLAKVDLPGLSKEDLKVWVENHRLYFKGDEETNGDEAEFGNDEEDDNFDGGPRSYLGSVDLAEGSYAVDQIKAELKNGVLKLVVPKLKLQNRSDVFLVNVD